VEPQDVVLGQAETADGCFIIDAVPFADVLPERLVV
jgi:hypothetical protein